MSSGLNVATVVVERARPCQRLAAVCRAGHEHGAGPTAAEREGPGGNLQAGRLARSHSLERDRTAGIARSDIPTDDAPLS